MSVNNENAGLPSVSVPGGCVTVVDRLSIVAKAGLPVTDNDDRFVPLNVALPPSAALIWLRIPVIPCEKSMPMTLSLGLAVAVSGNGSTSGVSTRISDICCCLPVAASV